MLKWISVFLGLLLSVKTHAQSFHAVSPVAFLETTDSTVGYQFMVKAPFNRFSGLLYMKKNESGGYTVSCMNIMGPVVFSLDLNRDTTRIVHCIEGLKGSKAMKLMVNSLKGMLHPFTDGRPGDACGSPGSNKYCYVLPQYICFTDDRGRIVKAVYGKGLRKVKYRFVYHNQPYPVEIIVKQKPAVSMFIEKLESL